MCDVLVSRHGYRDDEGDLGDHVVSSYFEMCRGDTAKVRQVATMVTVEAIMSSSRRHRGFQVRLDSLGSFNTLLLDGHKVVIGDWQSGRCLLIIRDEDVGENVGTGEAILSDGKVGDGFDCNEDTAH